MAGRELATVVHFLKAVHLEMSTDTSFYEIICLSDGYVPIKNICPFSGQQLRDLFHIFVAPSREALVDREYTIGIK